MWHAGFAHDLCGHLVHGHEKTVESVGPMETVNEVCPDRSLGSGERNGEADEWIALKTLPSLYSP